MTASRAATRSDQLLICLHVGADEVVLPMAAVGGMITTANKDTAAMAVDGILISSFFSAVEFFCLYRPIKRKEINFYLYSKNVLRQW